VNKHVLPSVQSKACIQTAVPNSQMDPWCTYTHTPLHMCMQVLPMHLQLLGHGEAVHTHIHTH